MATALSLVQLLNLHIAALGRYQGLLLKQAFLLGMQVNEQQFAKNKCVSDSTSLHIMLLYKHKHVEKSCLFSYISIQKLFQLTSQDNTLISVSGADQVVLWNETE